MPKMSKMYKRWKMLKKIKSIHFFQIDIYEIKNANITNRIKITNKKKSIKIQPKHKKLQKNSCKS